MCPTKIFKMTYRFTQLYFYICPGAHHLVRWYQNAAQRLGSVLAIRMIALEPAISLRRRPNAGFSLFTLPEKATQGVI